MKKIMMTLAAVAVAMTVSAQDKWYGSKEGGFAITFNANPVINYAGNMFNGNTHNTLEDFNGVDQGLFGGTTITGKYFLKDNLAIDFGFGFNNNYKVINTFAVDDQDKVVSYTRGTENNKTTTAFHLKGGIEYRMFPGQRLQPIFGADVVFQHTNKWSYTYFEEDVAGHDSGDYTYAGNPTNTLGLMLNAGVEYFIIPQISLGANLNFGVGKTWEWESKDNKPEGDGAAKNFSHIKNKTTWLKTGNVGANVTLNFYF